MGLAGLLSLVLLAGCMSPKGETVAEKRQAAQQMRSEALAQLYEIHPYAKGQIEEAAGYAVFPMGQSAVAPYLGDQKA